jgi:uncharacterized Zn-binding protein involved in type VI secretion
MKRYHITLGAKTTVGGTVITASSLASINGALMALEGDTVSCPACRSQGVIVCAGPRLPDNWNGKQYALQDDLCVCKCVPAPRLVATQALKCQHVQEEPNIASVRREPVGGAVVGKMTEEERFPLRLIEDATNLPHRNRQYRLDLLGGRTMAGTTDEDGLTQPLTASERSAIVAWQVFAPAPI